MVNVPYCRITLSISFSYSRFFWTKKLLAYVSKLKLGFLISIFSEIPLLHTACRLSLSVDLQVDLEYEKATFVH